MFEAHAQVYIYRITLLVVVFLFALLLPFSRPDVRRGIVGGRGLLFLLSLFCICFIGIRDWRVEEVFVDSVRYAASYLFYLSGYVPNMGEVKDVGYESFALFCANLGLSVDVFFLLCACLYVVPLAVVARRLSPGHCVVVFLMIITSMSFYNYGVNGIRNGIATSLLLLAIVNYQRSKLSFWVLAVLGALFHKSVLLPMLAYVVADRLPKVKWYAAAWLLAIPLSFVAFQVFSEWLLGISFIADRAENYLTGEADADKFSQVGFRYDFLLYSAMPIVVGAYFYFKRHFRDVAYERLLCCYLMANTVWVVINQVPYSNRFAYLSWFLMPLIIVYPFVYCPGIHYRYSKIGLLLLGYYVFTLIV